MGSVSVCIKVGLVMESVMQYYERVWWYVARYITVLPTPVYILGLSLTCNDVCVCVRVCERERERSYLRGEVAL